MPLSSDPAKRAKQLANLRAGAGAGDGGLARARSHGAYAGITAAELDKKVAEVYAAVGADLPVLDNGAVPRHDTIVVRQLAELLVRRERVRESEALHGIEIEKGPQRGKVRGVVQFGLALDRQILTLAVELGLTPRSRAALGLDLVRAKRASDGLDELAAQGRAARERAEAEQRKETER